MQMLSSTNHRFGDTSALPGGLIQGHAALPDAGQSNATEIALANFVDTPLPSREVLDALLDSFFSTVDWFMMV